MSDTWTIGELAERAAAMLGAVPRVNGQEPRADGPEQPRGNGRVREVPNERLIRWYTTIGLLDPPLGRRGRVALYGRRHLLQLVAVKRRQADGLSIAAIQAELTGATDAMLQRVAGLAGPSSEPSSEPPSGPAPRPLVPPSPPPPAPPPGWCGTRPEPGTVPATPDVARLPARDRFWARPDSSAFTAASDHSGTAHTDTAHTGTAHTGAMSPGAAHLGTVDPGTPRLNTVDPGTAHLGTALPDTALPDTVVPDIVVPDIVVPDIVVPDVVHGVRLAPGVTVLLDPAHRAPDGHEVAALRRAAAPLLTALATLGLAGPFQGPDDTTAFDPHASDTLEG
ncbi:helix-turn-helix domain-containing protein [Microbispora sp. H13382]|uniref:helix-turn-helix domain-containing protein n=1 Tax=Microbispora sp. H13382 TaxID=2729112 RepID=UPI002175AA65|nr:helix-turn-helix domain-containing protein [Microbispora sp. H13382]